MNIFWFRENENRIQVQEVEANISATFELDPSSGKSPVRRRRQRCDLRGTLGGGATRN
ncbi:hypothetical protein COLO4_38271 [Corchorus olitorius]|uniref:Uncharacterized protein n=1 Tax=Corchorus olitorius TaxID=93759 RepID=A0A1R3FVV3_9ROSI|nr:hypothetical protein COLO4_38271 [Corchorus olitorius]